MSFHTLRPPRTFDTGRAHESAGLIATDIDTGTAGGFPELADAVDRVVALPSVTSSGVRTASLIARAEGTRSFAA